jgi:hypothetical protein
MSAYERAVRQQNPTPDPPVNPLPIKSTVAAIDSDANPWSQLAHEWGSINSDNDDGAGDATMAPPDFQPPSQGGNSLHSASATPISPSTNTPSLEELAIMSRDAKENLSRLEELESEIMDMIDSMKVKDATYQTTIRKLEQDSSVLQNTLQGQLQALQTEYQEFKATASQQSQADRQATVAAQAAWQRQVQDLQATVQQYKQTALEESQSLQDMVALKTNLENQLLDLQKESTLMIDEFRTKFFAERDARYREVQKAQEDIGRMELQTRDMLLDALNEGQQQLNREWTDYTFQLIQKTEEVLESQNALEQASEGLRQKDAQLADLQAHTAYMQSLADGSLQLLHKVHDETLGGPLSTEAVDLPTLQQRVGAMVETFKAKDADYRSTMQRLQSEYSQKEAALQQQLQKLEAEYQQFQTRTRDDHTQELQAASEVQSRLQREVAELQTKLTQQVELTKTESEKAAQFFQRRLETERELAILKTNSTKAMDEFKALYEAEQKARLKEQRLAYERFQEMFRTGRRWVRDAYKDRQEEVKKVSESLSTELKAKDKELRKTKGSLGWSATFLIALALCVPVYVGLEVPPAVWDTGRSVGSAASTLKERAFPESSTGAASSKALPIGPERVKQERSKPSSATPAVRIKADDEPRGAPSQASPEPVETTESARSAEPLTETVKSIEVVTTRVSPKKSLKKLSSDSIPWGEYSEEFVKSYAKQ